MAKINAKNNKSEELTIDPGASGDSFLQFDINATGEFRIGVDDTASDAFKISQGSALGSNDTFIVSATGEITKPLQPAFLATTSGFINDQTGDGTVYTVAYATEYFDQNSDYASPTFTASVSGRYRLMGHVLWGGIAATNTSSYVEIVTSNRTYRSFTIDIGNTTGNQANFGSVVALCDMDVSDTAVIKVMASGGGKVVDIGFSDRGMFSGNLVC